MNFKIIISQSIIALTCYNLTFAQEKQSGNYTSEYVSAKTWSIDANRQSHYSDWKTFETRLVDNFKDFEPLKKVDLDKYGYDNTKKFEPTGFFRTIRVGDRWWIIDPEGHPGTNISINSVVQGPSERNQKAFASKFKNTESWAKQTSEQIIDLGFNGLGSWSNKDEFIKANIQSKTPVSYCVILNFMSAYTYARGNSYKELGNTGYKKGLIFAFDPKFPTFCIKLAQKLTASYVNDPNLFGYFTDNELPFGASTIDDYLSIPNHQDPNYIAASEWLQQKGITAKDLTPQLKDDFMTLAAEHYYKAVYDAIKSVDTKHLVLGTRLYRNEKNTESFMKVAGKYSDIISINYYGAWTPSIERMQDWSKWSNKPFIITEFYTKGVDTGFPNLSGAGWQVKNQEDRGKAYQNFCLGLLESKNCVGWHWFKYQDNDPKDEKASGSNTDSNKGMLDNDYNYYQPLIDKMKELNINRYRLIDYFDKLNN